MNWEQHPCGLIIPEKKPEPKAEPEKEREPPECLVGEPFGWNEDGSFTLCPESFKALKEMMLRKGGGGIRLPDEGKELIRDFANVIYRHQGVCFEEFC